MPEINWDSASELPSEGKYLCEIENALLYVGKTSGYEYFRLKLKLVDTGDTADDIMSFSPKAMGITRRKLRALGLEHITNVTDDDLIGKRIIAHIKHEEGMDGELSLAVNIGKGQAGYEAITQPVSESKAAAPANDFPFDDDVPM